MSLGLDFTSQLRSSAVDLYNVISVTRTCDEE